jgi:hypothetical protein
MAEDRECVQRQECHSYELNKGTLWLMANDGEELRRHVLAEGVGFEPTRGLRPWRFSRPLP